MFGYPLSYDDRKFISVVLISFTSQEVSRNKQKKKIQGNENPRSDCGDNTRFKRASPSLVARHYTLHLPETTCQSDSVGGTVFFFSYILSLIDIQVSSVYFVPQLALLMLNSLLVIFIFVFFFFFCCFLQTNWKHILFPVKTCQTRRVWTGEWKSFHEPTIGSGQIDKCLHKSVEPHANHMQVSQQQCGRVVFADLI